MKKLATLAALAALALPVIATEVTSSNVVGYTKVQLRQGLNLIGAQFQTTTSADQSIGDLVTVSGQGSYDEDDNPTTEIRTWVGNGYVTYGWTGSFLESCPDLASALDVDDHSYDNTWLDEDFGVTEETMSPGEGFWVKAGASGTATLVGQVDNSATKTISLRKGLNLVSSPWPQELTFDQITVTGQASYDEDDNPTTEIRTWVGNGYVTYGWTGSFLESCPDLAAALDVDDHSYDNTWLDEDFGIASDTIAVGEGFWIKAGAAGTVVFSK